MRPKPRMNLPSCTVPVTRTQLYADFQVARNALIVKMIEEGEKPEAIAKAISMDELQVWAITRVGLPPA